MSYIKRLKLHGFKSFAEPTVLTFEKGFNTIVGANGSGKSNVFDAMCFVLGRLSSKDLRTEKLGNLVFNGGKNLKPAKEAEVSLYLDNTNKVLLDADVDEIKLTRVVSKKGQSKYLLNNNKVTRTEIVELMRKVSINPDGYNIVLQGDIVKIVNMTPAERRELIEEISNISGYEEKREKGLKKLEQVEGDLKDADLLMEEKTKYLKELKSEKEAAEKYHQVKEDLRFSSLLLVKSRILRNKTLKTQKEEDLKKTEGQLEEFRGSLDEFEKSSKEIDSEIHKIEKKIEVESHNNFIDVTNKITSLEAELSKLNEKKAEYKKESDELKTKNQGLVKTVAQNKKEIAALESEIVSLEKQKKELEKRVQSEDTKVTALKKNTSGANLQELDDLDKQLDELNQKKADKSLIKQDNAIQIEKLNTKLEHLQQDMDKINSLNSENKDKVKQLEQLRSELKKLIIAVSDHTNKLAETNAKIQDLEKEYSQVLEEHSKVRMRLNASKEAMATNRAVDAMLKMKDKDKAIHGTVAELASVPDEYAMALETAAGRSLFNIVVDDDKTAVKYIQYLRQNKIGSVTFLPLNKIKAKVSLPSDPLNKRGVVDYALNVVSYDHKYEAVFNLIFSDTLVIDSVEDAKNIGIGSYKMVSLEGDYVAKSGAMSGGFKSRKAGLGLFKDDKLTEKSQQLDHKVETLRSSLELLKEEKEDTERELYELRNRKIDVEGEVAKLEKVLSIEGKDTSSIQKEVEAILSDKSVIDASLKKIDRELTILEEQIQKVFDKKQIFKEKNGATSGVSDLTKAEEVRDKLKEQLIELNAQLGAKTIQLNNVLKPELTNLDKILKEGETSLKSIQDSSSKITAQVSQLDIQLKEMKAQEKELSKGYKDLISQRDKLREKKTKLEQKYEKEFEKFDKIKEKAAQVRYAISEYETLERTLKEELEISFEQIRAEFNELGDEKAVEKQLTALVDEVETTINNKTIDVKDLQNKVNGLKTRMNSFGSINMKAVEIYDKLNEEFALLLEKRKTLNEEKEDILNFIAEIDEKKKERFMQTFVTLKKNFIEIFSKLSTKGQVELEIENEKDLFNSGVEIKVRLSKSNYLDIKSLSGGEKTITAVAFIFAVQEFNPASFYILDEIDAALDMMNSEKLGKLIREYSSKAQYIVVSHSEYFIQSSETIYGVTMNNNKISDVVSLDLRDTKEYLDDAAASVQS